MNIKQTITNYLSIFGLSQNPPTKTELESNVWFLAKIPMDINEHLVKMMDTIVQKMQKLLLSWDAEVVFQVRPSLLVWPKQEDLLRVMTFIH